MATKYHNNACKVGTLSGLALGETSFDPEYLQINFQLTRVGTRDARASKKDWNQVTCLGSTVVLLIRLILICQVCNPIR